jgi:hypothetical protein
MWPLRPSREGSRNPSCRWRLDIQTDMDDPDWETEAPKRINSRHAGQVATASSGACAVSQRLAPKLAKFARRKTSLRFQCAPLGPIRPEK